MAGDDTTQTDGGGGGESRAVILPAGLEHLPQIAALAGVIWRRHYPGIITAEQIEYMLERGYDVDELRDQITRRGVAFDRLLLGGEGGELIGFAAYGPARDGGEPIDEMKLHKLYLHPDRQRHGYGSLLLKHVERVARARGYGSLMLTVNKNNRVAIGAYQKNDFAVRESVVVDIGGGFVMDDYVMAKSL